MKLYKVVTEVPGKTVKAPGISETEVRREELFYVAERLSEVMDAIGDLLSDPERELISIAQALPAVIILGSATSANENQKGE